MQQPLAYTDLRDENYSGLAWNVFYEYGLDGEWWGHDGEYADELDAWFKDLDDALSFARECYPDDVLMEKLASAPDGDGADRIMLSIRSWEWIDGVDEMDGDEEYFTLLVKGDDGNIAVEEDSVKEL